MRLVSDSRNKELTRQEFRSGKEGIDAVGHPGCGAVSNSQPNILLSHVLIDGLRETSSRVDEDSVNGRSTGHTSKNKRRL